MTQRLIRDPKEEEIATAAKQLGPLKAPGPDGFQGVFYHNFWPIVKEVVVETVKQFFKEGCLQGNINHTLIALIPKCPNLEESGHFRPISLCNFAYQVISKLLANRLKTLLPKLVSPYQNAFVGGRQILVAHEAFHKLKLKKKGGDFEMGIKMDMNKAYDRLEWGFLRAVLIKFGFAVK